MENARICVHVVVLVSGEILSVLGRINPTTWPSCSLCLAQTRQCWVSPCQEQGGIRWGESLCLCCLLWWAAGCASESLQSPKCLAHITRDPSYALLAFLRSCSFQEPRVSSLLSVLILHVWQSVSAQESWCYNTCLVGFVVVFCSRAES